MLNDRPKPVLSDSAYKTANSLSRTLLPLLGCLYFALSMIIRGEANEWILGVILILCLFFGTAASQSDKNRRTVYDGEMVIVADRGGVRTFSLEVAGDPDDLALKDVIVFKVQKTSVPEPPEL
jgi:hypothetical protein